MNTLSSNNIAQAIYLATKDKTRAEQSKLLPQIVASLARRRLLSKSGDILARLNKIINKEEGKILVKVSSVEKLNEKTKKELLRSLRERYRGEEIILEEKIDAKLLGGFKIEVADEVIDLTLRNRMNKLEAHLSKN